MLRKIRLNSKVTTSQPEVQTNIIRPNISKSKGNQTTKFCQLIEYNKRNIFLEKYTENEARRLLLDFYLFFNSLI